MLKTLEEKFSSFKEEEFLRSNKIISENTLNLLKSLYDFTKVEEKNTKNFKNFGHVCSTSTSTNGLKKKKQNNSINKFKLSSTELPLDSLIIQSFDADQVWEELQLQNTLIYEALVSSVSKILVHNNRIPKEIVQESGDEGSSSSDSSKNGEVPHEVYSESDSNTEGSKIKSKKKNIKLKNKQHQDRIYGKSIVDDKFFNLAQMSDYFDKLEAAIERGESVVELSDKSDSEEDEDDDDDKNSNDDDDESHNYFYNDYFDQPFDENINNQDGLENSRVDQLESDDSSNDEILRHPQPKKLPSSISKSTRSSLLNPEPNIEINKIEMMTKDNSSNFEKRRKKIEEGIDLMEKEALEPKAWQFQGEITADKRPENSLLAEHLIFDHLIRQAPEITAETTLKLEDIIKQRIKDQAWDDVIRKIKPIENPVEYKKKLMLDSEKNRVGLAKIYEDEFIKQKKLEEEGNEETEMIPQDQIEIEKDLKILFTKLDALSNFHYTPKLPSTEIHVITNLPSIAIEEVAPVSVSDATLLAPQEIQDPSVGEIKGKEERTDTDKKRERRIKKKIQKIKRISREEKARASGITLQHVTMADKKLKKSNTNENKNNKNDEGFHNSKVLKSSKAFFSQLQQEVQSQIKGTLKTKRKIDSNHQLVAKKFKL